MIKVHVSKAILAKLPLDAEGFLPSKSDFPASGVDTISSEDSWLSGWHANLFTLQRRNCMLFVHDKTRFSVFLPLLKKIDFDELDHFFQDGLMNALLKSGIETDLLEQATLQLQPLCFDHVTDRSVQGSMTQIKADLESIISSNNWVIADVQPYTTSLKLSQLLRKVKDRNDDIVPVEEMIDFLKVGELKSPLLAQMDQTSSAEIIQFSDFKKT